MRCSGTNTSVTMTSWEPVPRMPAVCQVSATSIWSAGSSTSAGSIRSGRSMSAPTITQSASMAPVAHDHLPVRRTPPSAGAPRPVGARGAGASTGPEANTSSWTRRSNSDSIQLCRA